MNKENLAELDSMSGSSQQQAQLLKLDEVKLNGKDGNFTIKRKTQPKVKEGDREVYPKEELTGTLSLVFLKKRRQLIETGKGGTVVRKTNEHNATTDTVVLTDENGKREIGVAKDLREKYPNLRTNEVIYAQNLTNGEVLRLIIRGSSLHMQEEQKGITLFYDYLKEFKDDDKFYLFETEMIPTAVRSALGTIYTTHFKRGRKITDEEFKSVSDNIRSIHANTILVDAIGFNAPSPQVVETIDYDDDGSVNPESIPF